MFGLFNINKEISELRAIVDSIERRLGRLSDKEIARETEKRESILKEAVHAAGYSIAVRHYYRQINCWIVADRCYTIYKPCKCVENAKTVIASDLTIEEAEKVLDILINVGAADGK